MISLAGRDRVAYPPSATLPSPVPSLAPAFSGESASERGREAALGTDRRKQAVSATGRRRLLWARWRIVSQLLPEERIKDCRQYACFSRLSEGRAPSIVRGEEGYRLAGICRCKSIWGCPLCSGTETEQRRKALEASVEYWRAEGRGFLLITYTVSHERHDDLQQLVDRMSAARIRMCEQRAYKQLMKRYGIRHHVRSLEVTVGPKTGFHPHGHDLAFSDAVLSEADAERLAAALRVLWVDACIHSGLVEAGSRRAAHMLEHSVKVQVGYENVEQYIEKHGDQPRWSLAAEVAKGASKAGRDRSGLRFTPFQLVDAMMDSSCKVKRWRLEAWFKEYYRVFKGKHQLVWSKGAQAALKYVQLAPEAEDLAPELIEFTWPEWIATRRASAQCAVLEACDQRGYMGFLEAITSLVEGQIHLIDGQWLYEGFFDRPVEYGLDGRYRFRDSWVERQASAVPTWVSEPPEMPDPVPIDLGEYAGDDWF